MSSKKKTTATKVDVTPSLIPKLRFPEFQDAEGWQFGSLESVCEVLNNRRRPITGNERTPGPYPYYGASGIVDYVGDFIFDERLLLVGEDGAKWGAFEKTAFIADGKYWVNNHAHVLKPYAANDALLENYLTMQDLSPFVTGAAPPKLTLGKLKGIPVPLPPTQAEQQKIASCLSSLDRLLTAHTQKLNALKTHKKGLMQQLFPREGETVPRLRFPEFRGDREWVTRSFASLFECIPNNTFSRDLLNYDDGLARNIHYGDIHTKYQTMFRIQEEVVPYVNASVSLSKLKPEAYCKEGDLLFADASEDLADVGKSIELVDLNGERVLAGSHTILARQKGDAIIVGFAGYLFKGRGLRAQIEKEAQGTKVLQISASRMADMNIVYPENKDEQQRIASCLSSLDKLITAQTQKLEALKTHKKGLMQGLFPTAESDDLKSITH